MSQITQFFSNSGGGGFLQTLTGNDGLVTVPTAGNINVLGGNNITVTRTATSTETFNVTGTTNHAVQVGNATGSLTSLPLGTAGFVLTSNGAGVDPSFQATAGGGVTSITGDTGPALTGALTLTGGTSGAVFAGSGTTLTESFNFLALPTTTSTNGQIRINGTPVLHAFGTNNIFLGGGAGNFTTTSNTSTCTGQGAGAALTSGVACTAYGYIAAGALQSGSFNALFGDQSGRLITSGNNNTGCGSATLWQLLTGSNNTALGFDAGLSYTGAEASNISIGASVFGTTGESNTLRIGNGTGTGAGQLNASFISGIFGKTVGVITGVPVVIDNTDQLGTVVSSIRFKENVQPLNDSKVLDLQPVSFNYKETGGKSIGLIAEEVEKVIPEMVVYDIDGLPLTVRYLDLPILLLAEIKKLRAELDELKARL